MVAATDDAYRAAPLMLALSWRNSVVLSSVYRRVTSYSPADKRAVVVVASAEWMTHKREAEVVCY